jgi:hypothetical protein
VQAAASAAAASKNAAAAAAAAVAASEVPWDRAPTGQLEVDAWLAAAARSGALSAAQREYASIRTAANLDVLYEPRAAFWRSVVSKLDAHYSAALAALQDARGGTAQAPAHRGAAADAASAAPAAEASAVDTALQCAAKVFARFSLFSRWLAESEVCFARAGLLRLSAAVCGFSGGGGGSLLLFFLISLFQLVCVKLIEFLFLGGEFFLGISLCSVICARALNVRPVFSMNITATAFAKSRHNQCSLL